MHAKLFLEDDGYRAYRRWFKETVQGGERLVAPGLLAYELGRVIEREFDDEPVEIQQEVHRRSLGIVDLRPLEQGGTFRIASEGLTFYDAAYVALAVSTGSPLATEDNQVLGACDRLGVETVRF